MELRTALICKGCFIVLYFSSQRFAQQTPSKLRLQAPLLRSPWILFAQQTPSSSASQAAGAVAPFTLDIIALRS